MYSDFKYYSFLMFLFIKTYVHSALNKITVIALFFFLESCI